MYLLCQYGRGDQSWLILKSISISHLDASGLKRSTATAGASNPEIQPMASAFERHELGRLGQPGQFGLVRQPEPQWRPGDDIGDYGNDDLLSLSCTGDGATANASASVTVRSSGGGSIDLPLLLVLGAMLTLRVRAARAAH